MKIRTAIAALALGCLPAMGFAMGCSGHDRQVQSCAEGSVWDVELGTCVMQVIS